MSRLILFNKPYQVLSQFSDSGKKATLKDYLNDGQLKGCYPAGRLDFDSEGLLLLTDDGALQHRISHPQQKLAKYYWVQVEGEPTPETLSAFQKGIPLNDGPCKPASARIIQAPNIWERSRPVRFRRKQPTSWLEIVITEGRNRQVRRMCAAIGHPCLRLVRHRIGNWSLGQLKPGAYQLERVHLPKKNTPKQSMR